MPKGGFRFKIESGVAIPPTRSAMATKYPFNRMKKGDSIRVPIALARRADHAARRFGKLCKPREWKFTIRKIEQGAAVRIWRIK